MLAKKLLRGNADSLAPEGRENKSGVISRERVRLPVVRHKKRPVLQLACGGLVEAAGVEPASANDLFSALHAYPFNYISLISARRAGAVHQPVPVCFSQFALGTRQLTILLNDLRFRTTGTSGEGAKQVFKPLERSCRRWQLKVLKRFYESTSMLGMHR